MIYKNDYFSIDFPESGLIPGYMIIAAVDENVSSISDLDQQGQHMLSELLTLMQKTIQTVINPERIYTLSIGEIWPRLHFHVFPRDAELLRKYKAENNITDEPISGAFLFEWARKKYFDQAYGDYARLNDEIAACFTN